MLNNPIIAKKIRYVFYVLIVFGLLFCFGLVAQLTKINFTKGKNVLPQNVNVESKIEKNSVFTEHVNELISKAKSPGLVTSTVFTNSDIIYFYDNIQKGWVSFDDKIGKSDLFLTEQNQPIKILSDLDTSDEIWVKQYIYYTVFDNGRLMVKALDVQNKKITWKFDLGDEPSSDSVTSSFTDLYYDFESKSLLVHQSNLYDDLYCDNPYGCEGMTDEECDAYGKHEREGWEESEFGKKCLAVEKKGNNGILMFDAQTGNVKWEKGYYYEAEQINEINKNRTLIYRELLDYPFDVKIVHDCIEKEGYQNFACNGYILKYNEQSQSPIEVYDLLTGKIKLSLYTEYIFNKIYSNTFNEVIYYVTTQNNSLVILSKYERGFVLYIYDLNSGKFILSSKYDQADEIVFPKEDYYSLAWGNIFSLDVYNDGKYLMSIVPNFNLKSNIYTVSHSIFKNK